MTWPSLRLANRARFVTSVLTLNVRAGPGGHEALAVNHGAARQVEIAIAAVAGAATVVATSPGQAAIGTPILAARADHRRPPSGAKEDRHQRLLGRRRPGGVTLLNVE